MLKTHTVFIYTQFLYKVCLQFKRDRIIILVDPETGTWRTGQAPPSKKGGPAQNYAKGVTWKILVC